MFIKWLMGEKDSFMIPRKGPVLSRKTNGKDFELTQIRLELVWSMKEIDRMNEEGIVR